MGYIFPDIIRPVSPSQTSTSKMEAYKPNKANNNVPPYTPLEEVITVRDLLRRLADGRITLDSKIKV